MFRIDRSSVDYTKSSPPYIVTLKSAPESEIAESAPLSPAPRPQDARRAAESEAEAILAGARVQAEALLAEASKKAERIRADAYNKALESGAAESKRRVDVEIAVSRKEVQDLTRRLNEALNASLSETVDAWEDELLDLSIGIARKIINIEFERNDDAFKTLVQNALSHMRGDAKITIHVSPREYENYFSSGDAVFQVGGEKVKTQVLEDPLLERGGCIIESEGEMINAGVEQQLGALSAALSREEA